MCASAHMPAHMHAHTPCTCCPALLVSFLCAIWLADHIHTSALHRLVGCIIWRFVSPQAHRHQLTTWTVSFPSAAGRGIHKTWVLVLAESHVSLGHETERCGL